MCGKESSKKGKINNSIVVVAMVIGDWPEKFGYISYKIT